MKAILVYVPSRRGAGALIIPFGPMAVASSLRAEGWESQLHDFIFCTPEQLLESIEEYQPDFIGYSGIASSYTTTKEISHAVRKRFPRLTQMAGGPLASTYEYLLGHGVVDYVLHGEAEASLPKMLKALQGGMPFEDVGGLSRLVEGSVVRNAPEPQVQDLDTLALPAYDLMDVEPYVENLSDKIKTYDYAMRRTPQLKERIEHFISRGNDRFLQTFTSRGCTHACLFCYRHLRGIRRFSVEYAIRHIRHVVDTYNLKGISIADELFNSDTGWVYDFCDAVEAEFKGDLFIRILGARVANVDRKMLQRLWDVGAYEIDYGQESGSASILKGYRKGATIEQNEEVTNLSNEVGFFTPLQLVIGSPMETTRTIFETIGFMGRIRAIKSHTSINYLIPLPETPIWKHVMDNNMIPDVEAYLERVAQYGGMFSLGLNLTKAPRLLWILWWVLLYRAARMIEARERGRTLHYLCEALFLGIAWEYIGKRTSGLKDFIAGLFSPPPGTTD